jgi:predicted O-methyltransferase YrrM
MFKQIQGSGSLGTKASEQVYRVLDRLHLLEPLRRISRRRYLRRMHRCALVDRKGLVPEKELTRCMINAIEVLRRLRTDVPGTDKYIGDYLEFGVCFGSSMACMHDALTETGESAVRLFGFDSFEGLPEEASGQDGDLWTPGQLASPIEFASQLMTRRGVDWKRTFLIRGWFSQTLTKDLVWQFRIGNVGIVMIDSDLYISAKQALTFVAPLLASHSIIMFDDWKCGGLDERNLGEKKAFDEFMEENPDFKSEPLEPYSENSMVFLMTRTLPA